MGAHFWLKDLLIFLATAGLVVPLARLLRFGIVPAFILAGILLGPHGLGRFDDQFPPIAYVTFTDDERVTPFADLAILFLLFVIGLGLSAERLWSMRRLVFGLGALQVAVTAATVAGIAMFFGNGGVEALILGLALSFASTAIVVPVLSETGRWHTATGRTAFAVLLLQDLAVVPIVMLIDVLGGEITHDGAFLTIVRELGLGLAAVAAIVVAGRFGLGPILRLAAATGSRELVLAIGLFVTLAAGLITAAAGMSAALGAFLAGLLLSGSEFRHQLEIDIDPFKGLLLGLFFMTVGMGLDLSLLAEIGGRVLVSVVGLAAVKALVLGGLCLAFGLSAGVAVEVALVLAGCGEFAFVVLALARQADLVPTELLPFAQAVGVLTMLATPLLALAGRRLGGRLSERRHAREAGPGDGARDAEDHVVIGGYGRVGRMVVNALEASGISYVALDIDIERVREGRQDGRPVHFGDVSRREMLAAIGAENANCFVITADEAGKVERTVRAIRDRWPKAKVYARAEDEEHAARLRSLGASYVLPEAVEGGLKLAGKVLEDTGMPGDAVSDLLERVRAEGRKKR